MPEVELLSNFARMEAVPYLPPGGRDGRHLRGQGKAASHRQTTKRSASAQRAAVEVEPANHGEPVLIMPPANPVAGESPRRAGRRAIAEPPPKSGDLDLDALLFEAGHEADPIRRRSCSNRRRSCSKSAPWPERAEPAPAAEAALLDQAMPEANEARAAIPTVAARPSLRRSRPASTIRWLRSKP